MLFPMVFNGFHDFQVAGLGGAAANLVKSQALHKNENPARGVVWVRAANLVKFQALNKSRVARILAVTRISLSFRP